MDFKKYMQKKVQQIDSVMHSKYIFILLTVALTLSTFLPSVTCDDPVDGQTETAANCSKTASDDAVTKYEDAATKPTDNEIKPDDTVTKQDEAEIKPDDTVKKSDDATTSMDGHQDIPPKKAKVNRPIYPEEKESTCTVIFDIVKAYASTHWHLYKKNRKDEKRRKAERRKERAARKQFQKYMKKERNQKNHVNTDPQASNQV